MHKGVQSAMTTAPVAEIAGMLTKHDVGIIPVTDSGGLCGVVTDRDIACRAFAGGKDPSRAKAGDIMTADPVYCRENEEIGDAIHLMEDKQIRRLPVMDDNDRLVGMLSIGDVAHATSQEMAGEVIKAVSAHHEDPQLLKSSA
jgi:CBS domain-containing protein